MIVDLVIKNSKGEVFLYAASNDSIAQIFSSVPKKENLTDEDINAFRVVLLGKGRRHAGQEEYCKC